jgi:hypothetical protein
MQGDINAKWRICWRPLALCGASMPCSCIDIGFIVLLFPSYSTLPQTSFTHPFSAMPSYLFQKFHFLTVILCTSISMIMHKELFYLNNPTLSDMNSCSLLLWEIKYIWIQKHIKSVGYLLCAWEILLNGKHVKMVCKLNINCMGTYLETDHFNI